MKCLITGVTGFIGRHLSTKLLALGHQVVELKWEQLYKDPSLQRFVKEVNPDYIYHLAAYGNKYDQQDEWKILKANVQALFKLLQATKNIDYRAFINFSSSSTLLKYETFYSATKGAGERIVDAFVNKYGKNVVTVRPYSVYGPDDDPKHFIPVAIKAFKEDLELKVALGEHDWIYIDDFIDGLLKVAKNIEKLKGRCVNIGTGVSSSNYAIISILRDIFQRRGKVHRAGKLREYDNQNWVADNKVLKSLGWKPEIDLEEGLERLVYGGS